MYLVCRLACRLHHVIFIISVLCVLELGHIVGICRGPSQVIYSKVKNYRVVVCALQGVALTCQWVILGSIVVQQVYKKIQVTVLVCRYDLYILGIQVW